MGWPDVASDWTTHHQGTSSHAFVTSSRRRRGAPKAALAIRMAGASAWSPAPYVWRAMSDSHPRSISPSFSCRLLVRRLLNTRSVSHTACWLIQDRAKRCRAIDSNHRVTRVRRQRHRPIGWTRLVQRQPTGIPDCRNMKLWPHDSS
jgi:hypothetical protein